MKHIQPFLLFEAKVTRLPSGLTKKQEGFLNRYVEGTWSVNPSNGLVDVHGWQGNFYCEYRRLKSLWGISFGHVSGSFSFRDNDLQSLKGSPQTVGRSFYCQGNDLTSLEGAPQTVWGSFLCDRNKLTSLEGAPQTVGGDFYCSDNQLTSLEGAPQTVGGGFDCSYNDLTSLEGAPQTVVGGFYCNDNKLTSLEGAPQTVVGKFYCDLFEIQKGKWNMEGWMEVLNTGSEEAKKLILTLPVFQPEIWNSKLKEKPKATILQIVPIWDDLPKETQYGIQIPSNWKDGFDNLLDLQRAGIF